MENLPEVDQGETPATELPAVTEPAAPEPGETPEAIEEAGAKPAAPPESLQRRIDKLTRARYDAAREAAYWRGRAEGTLPAPGETEIREDGRPKQEAYESYEGYLEALTDWKLSTRLIEERAGMEELHQMQTLDQGFEAQVQAARAEFPDFDQRVYDPDLRISEIMREIIIRTGDGARLAYHLGQHPSEAARIAALPEVGQIMALGRLQATLEGAHRATPSTAPAPIHPVRGSAPARPGLHDDLSVEDWIKRRDAALRKR